MAAALAARKRARAAETSPEPRSEDRPEPPPAPLQEPPTAPPPEPADHPARPATAVPKLQSKPFVEEEPDNLASRLLKRRKDE